MQIKQILVVATLLCGGVLHARNKEVPVDSLKQQETLQEEAKKDFVKFGGAVRFNIYSKSWIANKTQPEATFDTWRLNVTARTRGVDLNFEYRFYPTFGTHFIKQGWLGYGFTDDLYMQLGVTQVPFGLTPYASHSWWFQGAYYIGLEDDYDMGIKFDYKGIDKLDLSLAYFRQSEPEGPQFGGDVTFGGSGAGRYSYDLVPADDASNRELNQFNLRAAYHLSETLEVGLSGQVGGNYNSVLNEATTSYAAAGHVLANLGKLTFKGEVLQYNYAAKDNTGKALKTVQMGAYGFTNMVATEGRMYMASLSYSIPVDFGPINGLEAHVDYTYTDKIEADFTDMQHLIPGFLITAGSIYTYIDLAMGKNQPWLTSAFGTGLGEGTLYSSDAADKYYNTDAALQGTPVPMKDLEWEMRFNINIGYYF